MAAFPAYPPIATKRSPDLMCEPLKARCWIFDTRCKPLKLMPGSSNAAIVTISGEVASSTKFGISIPRRIGTERFRISSRVDTFPKDAIRSAFFT
ncbi:hypothetical protein D3C71_1902810 [compost metagenome]